MTELNKDLVALLNKPPFSKNMTLIGFDALTPLQLLQCFNDILAAIAPDHNVDLRQEEPQATVVRMMSLLSVLKYRPTQEPAAFREGLVQGSQEVLYPIMHWALTRLDELKKRAYLSTFLMTIDVPEEFLQDDTVAATHGRYMELIEVFKSVHKETEALRNSGFSTSDVKNDIKHMEDEKAQLERRVQRLKQKYENVNNYKGMLEAAQALRREQEREDQLQRQREDQTNQLALAESKLQRTMQQLREARANSITGGPEGVLARAEEELKMNEYLSQTKLPQALAERQTVKANLERIAKEPAMTVGDLDDIHQRIQEVTRKINGLLERRMTSNGTADNKAALFKQQASIIGKKKEVAAETLQKLHDDLSSLQRELEDKKSKQVDKGPKMLKEEEFKRYMAKLRTKSTEYKEKKAAMTAVQSEYLVLARTVEILEQQLAKFNPSLVPEQDKPRQQVQQEKSKRQSEAITTKAETREELTATIELLTASIESKKTELAPLIKDLRALRHDFQAMEAEYKEKKATYEAQEAALDGNKSREEQEVTTYRDEAAAEESRYHHLQTTMKLLTAQQKMLEEEMARYVGQQKDGKSLRDLYGKHIQEQETLSKYLRERQRVVQESHEPNLKQLELWVDLEKLLQAKLAARPAAPGSGDGAGGRARVGGGSGGGSAGAALIEEEDRLVF